MHEETDAQEEHGQAAADVSDVGESDEVFVRNGCIHRGLYKTEYCQR